MIYLWAILINLVPSLVRSEPRRLRSAGMPRPIMLPDVFHRGGPRIQEQTFGKQTSQKEAITILQDTTAITEEEARKLIGRISPKEPVNIYTMGVAAATLRAKDYATLTERVSLMLV
jgi:hypothetical protein